MIGIGIDTGGTYTDAVLYDFDTETILAEAKALTTKQNLETGISNALDGLPQDQLRKAEMISLSTTLATNACIENKGVRAKLLLLGFDPEMMENLKDIYASYGLKDMTRFVVMDARAEGVFTHPCDPDWKDLEEHAQEYFADCESVGIVQKYPKANGGRFEITALQILKEKLSVPLTVSFNISSETDILKTCAGTLLNARLIPLIREFLEAVHRVMQSRQLDLPISIVRSDGTRMSERMAMESPVETILCGPAASAAGGAALAGKRNGIIVDMGGTTTDIALLEDRLPVMARNGIRIGQWKTMVRGLQVETFELGGDSAVRYKNNELVLDSVRVIPLSILAAQDERVLPYLEGLAAEAHTDAAWPHEFFVLLRDISGKTGYTEKEKKICSLLGERPLSVSELARRMNCLPRFLSTGRLEEEEIIIRSGLTPTDIMILKGDYMQYRPDAARAALQYFAANVRTSAEEIPDLVYEMVIRRLYRSIGRVILHHQYAERKETDFVFGIAGAEFTKSSYENSKSAYKTSVCEEKISEELVSRMLDLFYAQAQSRKQSAERKGASAETTVSAAVLELKTELPLIGVGAPVHLFLPAVAGLLGTEAVIPEHASVANALGAATCRKRRQLELIIKAEYASAAFSGYSLYDHGKRFFTKDREKAVEKGRQVLLRSAEEWAEKQGLTDPDIILHIKENRLEHRPDGLLVEIVLLAVVSE